MSLPIAKILWAANDANHHDHLHVEGIPRLIGWTTGQGTQPPANNPGLTPSTQTIMDALIDEFGPVAYMNPDTDGWSSMGWYNRRPIGGSTQWSQHAWANAIDIGPYHGVAQQQRFYDFLIGDMDMLPPDWAIPATQWHIDNNIYSEDTVDEVDESEEFHRQTVFRFRMYNNVIKGQGGTKDQTARNAAKRANDRLDGIRIPD